MYVLSLPAIYSLEITPACNNHCPGCSNVYSSNRTPQPMSLVEWGKIIASLGQSAVQIRITGGEPTLHPDFIEILDLATSFDGWVTVFTNGQWRYPDTLVKRLRGFSHLSGLLISLHGANPESHEAFTKVKGSFDKTIRNIRLAIDYGIQVSLSTIMTRQSLDEIDAIVALAKELGVQHVAFNRFLGMPIQEIEPSFAQITSATRHLESMIRDGAPVKYGIGMPQCFEPNSSEGCLAGVAYVAIDPWGNLRPCAHATTITGSLIENSLAELWHGTKMQAWRNLMPQECQTCAAYFACHGGCRAMAEIRPEHRDPLRMEPLKSFSYSPTQLELPVNGKPVLTVPLREESFGYSLLYNGRIMIVRKEARAVIEACKGQENFAELAEKYGQQGLDLLGELWSKGMLKIQ